MFRHALTAVAALTFGTACLDNNSTTPSEQIYQSNLAKWNESGPASYDITLTYDCICGNTSAPAGSAAAVEPVRVEVRNRVITGRFFVNGGDPVPANVAAAFPDVPGLFALIRDAIDRKVFYLGSEFDETYGHPTVIQIDYGTGAANSVNYHTVEFTAVP